MAPDEKAVPCRQGGTRIVSNPCGLQQHIPVPSRDAVRAETIEIDWPIPTKEEFRCPIPSTYLTGSR